MYLTFPKIQFIMNHLVTDDIFQEIVMTLIASYIIQ